MEFYAIYNAKLYEDKNNGDFYALDKIYPVYEDGKKGNVIELRKFLLEKNKISVTDAQHYLFIPAFIPSNIQDDLVVCDALFKINRETYVAHDEPVFIDFNNEFVLLCDIPFVEEKHWQIADLDKTE